MLFNAAPGPPHDPLPPPPIRSESTFISRRGRDRDSRNPGSERRGDGGGGAEGAAVGGGRLKGGEATLGTMMKMNGYQPVEGRRSRVIPLCHTRTTRPPLTSLFFSHPPRRSAVQPRASPARRCPPREGGRSTATGMTVRTTRRSCYRNTARGTYGNVPCAFLFFLRRTRDVYRTVAYDCLVCNGIFCAHSRRGRSRQGRSSSRSHRVSTPPSPPAPLPSCACVPSPGPREPTDWLEPREAPGGCSVEDCHTPTTPNSHKTGER